MAADLPDDLLLKIILRLPLKHAVQCSCLSKNFYNHISHPTFACDHALLLSSSSPITGSSNTTIIFRCSAPHPKIFTRLFNNSLTTTAESISISSTVTLPAVVPILASCNGVVLLRVSADINGLTGPYYVFNPITGGIMIVDYPIDAHQDVGLAVDFPAADCSSSSSSSHKYNFKLVMFDDVKPISLRFTVVVPSTSAAAVVKSKVDFVCPSFDRVADSNIRPVYAHGCLHWLGDNGRMMVAFDVEKEEAKLIKGPLLIKNDDDIGYYRGVDKWLGFSQGSIRFIYTLPEEENIVVHSHDYLVDEWLSSSQD